MADLKKGLKMLEAEDYLGALQELEPLAEQGDAEAQLNLGLMYAEGNGVAKNYKLALKWFEMAARQGEEKAQVAFACIYIEGKIVPQNYIHAYAWASLGVRREADAGSRLRSLIARLMSPEDIETATELQKSINNG